MKMKDYLRKEFSCLCAGLLIFACSLPLVMTAATGLAAQKQVAAAVPASGKVPDDPALEAYYITSGEKFNQVKALLESLPSAATGLNQYNRPYGFKLDRNLTGDYFYHVQSYRTDARTIIGDYLVAKDNSCAWRLNTGKEAMLIFGTADKLIQKAKVVLNSKRIVKGDYGTVRVLVPGPLPYDLRLTSLNESVAKISADQKIIPVSYGKVDILADLKIGETVRSCKLRAYVVDQQEWSDERGSSSNPSIGIGIGIGIGGWHHHHGGIDIGIGFPGW